MDIIILFLYILNLLVCFNDVSLSKADIRTAIPFYMLNNLNTI
jgi:hypothetical protein